MVVREGRYYGLPFKGYRGVTQCNPLPPTILNMVVNSVIFHWASVVTGEDVGP